MSFLNRIGVCRYTDSHFHSLCGSNIGIVFSDQCHSFEVGLWATVIGHDDDGYFRPDNACGTHHGHYLTSTRERQSRHKWTRTMVSELLDTNCVVHHRVGSRYGCLLWFGQLLGKLAYRMGMDLCRLESRKADTAFRCNHHHLVTNKTKKAQADR